MLVAWAGGAELCDGLKGIVQYALEAGAAGLQNIVPLWSWLWWRHHLHAGSWLTIEQEGALVGEVLWVCNVPIGCKGQL